MRPTLALVLSIAVLAAHAAESDDARIARVEHGLRGPVAVRGEPPLTYRLLERMRDLHVPGVSIALIDHGELAWVRAYGVADVRSARPVTPDTLFQVASISKSVAAVAAMRLAARGQLDLDEDVNRRLRGWRVPDHPWMSGLPVTARMLLSHTAGVTDQDLAGYPAAGPVPTLAQVLRGAPPAATPPVRVEMAPGSRYAYSSLGYAVLQQYLDDVTGRPFAELAQDTVLRPLAMRDSVYALAPPLAARAAAGHDLQGAVLEGGWRLHPELAAAGLWTTAPDLARFVLALLRAGTGQDASFLPRERVRALFTPVRDDYGLGFELGHEGSQPVFHHSGSNWGYKALVYAYARTGQGAVILTNGDGGWALIEEVMRAIAAEYGWPDFRQKERAAAPADMAAFDRLVGDYAVSNVTLRVERREDRLVLSGPPLGPMPVELVPAGGSDYFVRERDVTLHADDNGDGPVQTLTFVDGRARPGRRIAR